MSAKHSNINHIWNKGNHDKAFGDAQKDFKNNDYSSAEDYISQLFEAVEYWRDMASTYSEELNHLGYVFDEDGFSELGPDAPDPMDRSERDISKLANLVAFCALMQNNGGVIEKSPDYILEKFNRYCTSTRDEVPWGLDGIRRSIVSDWCKKWLGMTYNAGVVRKWIDKLKDGRQS